jgi:regulator of sigma E protease
MEFLADFGDGLFWFLILLTPLIFVHEMGHFWVARRCGVRVEVFSIGFGPEIYGWNDRHGTRWKISAVPLGGYVKMFGEHLLEPDESGNVRALTLEEKSVSFQEKRLGQRAAIVAAGPAANYLFAMVVLTIMFMTLGQISTPPDIGRVAPDTAAAAAGLETGDYIMAVDGDEIESYEQFNRIVRMSLDQPLQITVRRAGAEIELSAVPRPLDIGGIEVGDLGTVPYIPAKIGEVMPGSAAEEAGFFAGDWIESIDGEPVELFDDLRRIVQVAPDRPLRVVVRRDGVEVEVTVTPRPVEMDAADGTKVVIGQLGVRSESRSVLVKYGPIEAVGMGVWEPIRLSGMMLSGLGRIVVGALSSKQLGGPIMIAQESSKRAGSGWAGFIGFMALISINLGLINLLPIPVLDGGHLMFYAAEAVRGRPVGEKAQEYSFKIGLALVISLMIFVTVNDLLRIIS